MPPVTIPRPSRSLFPLGTEQRRVEAAYVAPNVGYLGTLPFRMLCDHYGVTKVTVVNEHVNTGQWNCNWTATFPSDDPKGLEAFESELQQMLVEDSRLNLTRKAPLLAATADKVGSIQTTSIIRSDTETKGLVQLPPAACSCFVGKGGVNIKKIIAKSKRKITHISLLWDGSETGMHVIEVKTANGATATELGPHLDAVVELADGAMQTTLYHGDDGDGWFDAWC